MAHKKVHRDKLGQKVKTEFVHTIEHRKGSYNYRIEYHPKQTQEDIERDAAILASMSDEQADKLDEHASAYGTVVQHAGLTATIADCATHIDGPNRCRLLLRFFVAERNILAGKDFEAGTPRQLPNSQQVTDYIKSYLADLAND